MAKAYAKGSMNTQQCILRGYFFLYQNVLTGDFNFLPHILHFYHILLD